MKYPAHDEAVNVACSNSSFIIHVDRVDCHRPLILVPSVGYYNQLKEPMTCAVCL